MSIRISGLEIENVKKVKAFAFEPAPAGLTVIGGKNGNGKTSVLDSIAWALGGAKREPSNAQRAGAMNPPHIKLTLTNGLIVERKGKSSALSVVDPTGKRGGQALLDEFVSSFAIDLPKFLQASPKDKAQMLLNILGVGPKLAELDQQENTLYSQRHAIGQIADSKAKHAAELPEFPDTPDAPVSAMELIQQQQSILAKNGENQRLRAKYDSLQRDLATVNDIIIDLEAKLASRREQAAKLAADIMTAQKSVSEIQDESTAEIEASLESIEAINAQVAANQAKQRASDEAADYKAQRDALTAQIDAVRADRLALLDGAPLPLPGLSVIEGNLAYNGAQWDCMSGSEQLRVAVAIVRHDRPDCGFVLMDKLEQFDLDTLAEFGAWLEAEKLQVIATRVSTGEECSIIIEDGLPAGKTYTEVLHPLPAAEPVAAVNSSKDMEW